MAEYVYTTVPAKLKDLLDKIRQVGVPEQVTTRWLKSIGFTSSNDPSLLSVLRHIGFIDESKSPTQYWFEFRGANHRQILGNAIREGYPDLFKIFPDAHARDAAEIENVVRTSSSGGDRTVALIVRTFRELCAQADFSGPMSDAIESETRTYERPREQERDQTEKLVGPSLHIDIQVHISPEATPEQIDKIFESMARHLYRSGM